ncbi:MAG: ABC transporter permease [Lentisphaeria bacterium]|nr:ABC transporter permease [Lentisphaeria bacterium]
MSILKGNNHVSVRGVAPWRLVICRLRRHRLAMAGLGLLVFMCLFVLAGGCLVDTRAEQTRLWVGARPPGFSHPHCQAEMIFEVGGVAPLAGKPARCERLVYECRPVVWREFRIVTRRGEIQSITEGATSLDELDLSTLAGDVFERLEGNVDGRRLPKVKLVRGERPADGMFADGQRVLFAGWRETGQLERVSVRLVNQRVTEIRAGVGTMIPVNRRVVRGHEVEKVIGDGKELRLTHPLGTDELGRDMLLRVVNGGRVSLLVAAVATTVSLLVGVSYGAVSGYAGGATDAVLMRVVDILYGLPFIFLVLVLMVVFNRNIILLFAALGLVQWLTMARIVRGHMMSLKQQEFVEAARMGGASPFRVVFYHLLPHALGPIVVYATLTVPVVILEESFLAFIGLPVQFQGTTLDSWGSLVHMGMAGLGEGGQKWWLLVFPSLAMVLTLFGLNCFGDGLRDSLDPRQT